MDEKNRRDGGESEGENTMKKRRQMICNLGKCHSHLKGAHCIHISSNHRNTFVGFLGVLKYEFSLQYHLNTWEHTHVVTTNTHTHTYGSGGSDKVS